MPLVWTNHMAQASVHQKSKEIDECLDCKYCGQETPITELSTDEGGHKICPFCLK